MKDIVFDMMCAELDARKEGTKAPVGYWILNGETFEKIRKGIPSIPNGRPGVQFRQFHYPRDRHHEFPDHILGFAYEISEDKDAPPFELIKADRRG